MRMRPRATILMAAATLLIDSALGWVTLSQARLGAQLYDIREQTRGNHTSVPPLQKLGYVWSLPDDAASSAGLGGTR